MNQRWRNGRERYRPPGEVIRSSEYDVAELPADTEAKQFVVQHHYSGSYPAARFRFGLYRHGTLVGVSVFSHPCNDKVLTTTFPWTAKESVELGRFVLLDEVPGNGETWFLARCFERLRSRVRGVVSFSDPVPRTDRHGHRVFPGHIGTIYQAHNGVYLGRGTARTLRLLPNGAVLSDRTLQKIRAGEQGWRYSAGLLEAWGAQPCPEGRRAEWLMMWLPKLTRTLRHPGNHKYAWVLQRSERRRVALLGIEYPKAA